MCALSVSVVLLSAPGLPVPPAKLSPSRVWERARIMALCKYYPPVSSYDAVFHPDGRYEARPSDCSTPDGDPRDYEEGWWWTKRIDDTDWLCVVYKTHWTSGHNKTNYQWDGQKWSQANYEIRPRKGD
jgi:hypothetical protein